MRAQTDPDWRLWSWTTTTPTRASPSSSPPRRPACHLRPQRDQPRHHRQLPALPRAGPQEWMVFFGATTSCCRRTSTPSAPRSPEPHRGRRGVAGRDGHRRRRRPLGPAGGPGKAAPLRPAAVGADGPRRRGHGRSLLRGNWTYWPSLAFRVEPVRRQGFIDDFPLIQDLALLIDLALAGSRMLVLPDVVFAYRRHSQSASSTTVADGGRFRGERDYFAIAARRCEQAGGRAPPVRLGCTPPHACTQSPRCPARAHPVVELGADAGASRRGHGPLTHPTAHV